MLVELHKVKTDLRDLSSPLNLSQLFINSCSSISQKSFKIFSHFPRNPKNLSYIHTKHSFLNMLWIFTLYIPLLMSLLFECLLFSSPV